MFGPDPDDGPDDGIYHICLFCRDPDFAARAVPALEEAVRTFRTVEKLELELWPFDGLDDPAVAECVTRCAESADVVAIAVDGNETMSMSLLDWLELWEERRADVATRLLAFCHAQSPAYLPLAPAFCDLTSFAIRSGVGMIWCGVPDADADSSSLDVMAG